MTVVNIKAKVPSETGLVDAVGALRWQPTARRVDDTTEAVVLPASFTVDLVDGAAEVNVEPSTLAWVWYVTESFHGVPDRRRAFVVPSSGPVNYKDLVEVDPASLDPAPSPDPAWLAPFNELAAGTVTPDPDNPGFYLIGASS